MIKMVNNHIKIDQSLHGYSNGHSLLASSLDIPRELKREILVLSDMSGSSMVKGFESYLTGYPLTQIGMYVLARTWYASEMRRPGCVWTHTLFIDFSDLTQIKNIGIIQNLFKRPCEKEEFSSYNDKVIINIHSPDSLPTKKVDITRNTIYLILAALYNKEDKVVLIPANNSNEYENLVLSIWMQQWPRIQRNFYFCTGSLSNRMIERKPFELQVVARSNLRNIQNNIHNVECVDTNKITNFREIPAWAEVIINDLSCLGDFRKFIWRYGADITQGKRAFISLAKIFTLIKDLDYNNENILKLLNIIGENFFPSEEAISLKESIFGGFREKKKLLVPHSIEKNLLFALATTKYHLTFEKLDLNISSRGIALWNNSKNEAKDLLLSLINNDVNIIGESLLESFAKVVNISNEIELFRKYPNLLYIFIKINPSIAKSPEIWIGSIDHQKELFDILLQQKALSSEDWKWVVYGMLEAEVGNFEKSCIENFKESTIKAILEWIEKTEARKILKFSWKEYLYSQDELILSWLKQKGDLNVKVVILVATFLNPNSSLHCQYMDMWLTFGKNAQNELDNESIIEFMAFLLAIGFNNRGEKASKLISTYFEIVHNAVNNNQLSYNYWKFLQVHTVPLIWWKDWDKCEKLRRAFVAKFIDNDWPIEDFLNAVKSKAILSDMFVYCKWNYKKSKFYKKLKEKYN